MHKEIGKKVAKMVKKAEDKAASHSKSHAIKHRTGEKLHKTHHSSEYCRHCGVKTRSTTTHESGHREYDHVDAPDSPVSLKR